MAYLADHAGVERRAGRDDDDLVDVAQVLVGQAHLVELQQAVGAAATEQRVGDRARLLEDLLAHEPVVAVLLGGREVPVDVVAAALGGRAVEAGDADALAGDGDDLVLVELHRLAGVLDEGRDVGAEEVLALADADHERAVAAGRDDAVGVLGVDGDEREGALEAAADVLHGDRQVDAGLELLLQQVGRDLGVGVGGHLDALGLEARAQLGEVLDDPVVHERDAALAPEVRVGVAVGRRAVGRPAGVADAGGHLRQRGVGDGLLEVGQLAGALVGHDRAAVDEGDPRGVVAPVLQAPEALDHDAFGRLGTYVPDDSAHGRGVYLQAAARLRPRAVPQSHPCPRSHRPPTARPPAMRPPPTSSSSARRGRSWPERPRRR